MTIVALVMYVAFLALLADRTLAFRAGYRLGRRDRREAQPEALPDSGYGLDDRLREPPTDTERFIEETDRVLNDAEWKRLTS